MSWLDKLLLAQDRLSSNSLKKEVINLGKEACQVSATSIGLLAECSLGSIKIYIISLHRPRDYWPMPRNFKLKMDLGSAVQKTLLSICKSLLSDPAQKRGKP